jgi:hypothetical protein
MKLFILFRLLIFIQNSNNVIGFCESQLYNNTIDLNINKNSTLFLIKNNFKYELGNSISSFIYTIYGAYGLTLKNNHINFYILMNIFILLGLSSGLHHFFYTKNYWGHLLDINCVIIIISFSLITLLTNNKLLIKNYKKITNILFAIITTSFVLMLTFNIVYNNYRSYIIYINSGFIVIYQFCTNIHLVIRDNYNSKNILVLKNNIINLLLIIFAKIIWNFDSVYCSRNIINYINFHSLWHIFSCIALYNTINNNNLYYAIINNKNYIIYYPFKLQCLKYLMFNIEIIKNKITYKNSSTSAVIEELNLLSIHNIYKYGHRRIKSCG